WDNSWRDDFNWDAAWVFFKYKKRGLENPWQHAYLSSSGHVLSTAAGNEGGGYAYMVGANAGKVNGLYVMRNGISEGNVSVRLQAKWALNGTGLTSADFGDALNGIYVAVHAIEMVYVPYGAYYLGDASSYKSFAVGDTAAVVIDSESALTLSTKNGMPNVSLAASYPKGYVGFYVMKYETSQEQYVEFLNSLTLEQQKARVTNNNFSAMKRGDYVFGDITQPSCRNGIVFIEQRKANTPVVFGNNLNPANDLFSTDDGQTLACNYMSIEDMIAYCSWSGLRPMSELEYEKACRRFYPQVPDKGEYAWNTNNGVNRLNGLGDLNYRGDEREQALSYLKNVNSGTTNSINGPVRCGLFATSATNQTQAGATYWAVMEMSGNLKELCANVNYSNLNGGSCGTGIYNPTLWNASTSYYGVRGGGFSSPDSLLRTSDRTEIMNYFTTITQRDSTVGFRGVYSLSGIKIEGGEIQGDTTCPGNELRIVNVQAPSCPDFPDMRFQYNWYVKKPGEAKFDIISNASGESFTYKDFENTGTTFVLYQFKRTGICAMGMAETITNVYVAPVPWTVNLDTYTNVYPSFTVTSTWATMPKAHWKLDNAPTGISIADKGVMSGLTANSVFFADVTVSSDKCPGQSWTKTLEVRREFGYTGGQQSITLAAGKYKMECWGAQGGIGYINKKYPGTPGTGGYSYGELQLISSTTFYIYTGGQGGDAKKNCNSYCGGGSPGWNGGGWGGDDDNDDNGGGGGGASDIRLVSGNLYSRIMVAGGGGGAKGSSTAGNGGGVSGGGTKGASQTSGYAFGQGGAGGRGGSANGVHAGGGGGGGYYGAASNGRNMGCGGSGFVSGMEGCDAITGDGNLTPTGQPNHYSGLIFRNASMSNGVRSGNGLVRISPVAP
ncbi:MAG: glycine-rich protein, partial [Oscillibacter sp.]|nr:glycine-rich protein [Oscillibacter sp.]